MTKFQIILTILLIIIAAVWLKEQCTYTIAIVGNEIHQDQDTIKIRIKFYRETQTCIISNYPPTSKDFNKK